MKNGFQKAREELERMGRTVESCPFRTRFHIMPPVGWLNDPNGLCQFRGLFHAYFQYSPLNVHGGGGYWGHCTSRDLIHWDYQEPALTTDIPEDRSGVYSGSALIENGRMYLFYTGNVKFPGDYDYIDAGRISTQLLVESEDGWHMSEKVKLLGMEDYPEEITEHVRDPKVWKEDGRYYMVLGRGPEPGMRTAAAGTRAAFSFTGRRIRENGNCIRKSCRRGRLAICGNVRISFTWERKRYCPSALRAWMRSRNGFKISTSLVIPCWMRAKIQRIRFRNGIWGLTFTRLRHFRPMTAEGF